MILASLGQVKSLVITFQVNIYVQNLQSPSSVEISLANLLKFAKQKMHAAIVQILQMKRGKIIQLEKDCKKGMVVIIPSIVIAL